MNKSIVEPIKIKPNYPVKVVDGEEKVDYDAFISRASDWWPLKKVEPKRDLGKIYG